MAAVSAHLPFTIPMVITSRFLVPFSVMAENEFARDHTDECQLARMPVLRRSVDTALA